MTRLATAGPFVTVPIQLPIQAPHDSVVLQGLHKETGEPIDLVYWGPNSDEVKNTLIIRNNGGWVEIMSGYSVRLFTSGGMAAEFSSTRAWINDSLNQHARTSAYTPSSGEGAWWCFDYGDVGVLPKFEGAVIEFDLGPVEPLTSSSSANNSLSTTHFGRFNRFSHSSAKLLVQTDSDVSFPHGAVINCQYTGSGTLTVQEDTSVTVTASPTGMSLVVQPGGCFTLRKVANNSWILLGALVPL
jgi:hypothetical protein